MPEALEFVLGGLLHDVGKFAQRAFPSGQGIGREAEAIADYICPSAAGHRTHLHAVYTAQFILDHLDPVPEGVDKERVLRLASYHHRPSCEDEQLIAQADRLSSGMEREDDERGPTGAGTFRRVRLRSIANEVNLAEPAPGIWSVGLGPLDPRAAFPVQESGAAPDLTAEYASLWSSFLADWSSNRLHDPWAYINRSMSCLERYTWCIPSATNVYPDISLFDHMKTTAAIAGCLAQAGMEVDTPFLLVTGALSGIQSFLFDVQAGAGGLARRLRARSLFLSLAMENTVHFVLRRLRLPLTNCVLCAGGRFTLLLPNTEASHQAVQETEAGLQRWAREEVGCELHPHLASLQATRDDLFDFGALLARLGHLLERTKARPLAYSLTGPGGWEEDSFVLDPLSSADGERLCSCCQRRMGPLRQVREGLAPICDGCFDDAEMGRQLVKARYVALTDTPGRLPFGSHVLVESEDDLPRDAYLALDLDGGSGELPGTPVVGRYVARFVPRDEDGSVTEFSDIAERSKGRKALSYLKADVDNLGLVFYAGLTGTARDRRSISRMSTLSRSLELFFAGYVQHLAASFEHIYTVYSGGDDLLLVGPWNVLLNFALRLREDFRRYTCGNPSWSMSAGLVLVGQKTPVLLAADEAEDRLEAAKQTRGTGILPWPPGASEEADQTPTKDRLVAFGTSLRWDRAAEAVSRGEDILRWLASGDLSTGQVRRLLAYAQLFQHWQRTGDVLGFRYAPMLVYDVKRNWRDAPADALEWVQTLTLPDGADMPVLRFVCEYALYGVRGHRDEGGTQS